MITRVELPVELSVAGLARHHSAYESAVDDFLDCARSTPGTALRERDQDAVVPGKGSLYELSLVIDGSSAAAIAGAGVAVFRSWLNRDRRRRVRVQVKSADSEPIELMVDGDNISLKTLERAIESAAKLRPSAPKSENK